MSKRIPRAAFAVLIVLAIAAGIYASVQAASLSSGLTSGRVHVDAGLNVDASHSRVSVNEVSSFVPQVKDSAKPGHHCDSEEGMNPSDY